MPKSTRTLALLSLLAALAGASACSTIAVRPDAVRTAAAHDGLACTPLALMVVGDGKLGMGSGVLVHERVVLTAAHIIVDGPRRLAAQAAVARASGQPADQIATAPIQRIIDGGGAGAAAGDWALIVLERPFEGLEARLAAVPRSHIALRPGDAVRIAGFPAEGHPLDRSPILIDTVCIRPPAGATAEPGTIFARGVRGEPDHGGLSGAPVLAGPPGAQELAGVYLGSLTRHFAGIFLGQEMVMHTLPLEEIRRVISEVAAEDRPGVGAAAP